MTEIWKVIDGYENYMISNLGRVKSLNYRRTGKEKVLNCGVNSDGYLFVSLCKNNKSKLFFVHRLVAQTFIPNLENKPCVDHINTIRNDNRVENLRWVTIKENNNNELTKQKMSSAMKGKILSDETKQKISLVNKGKILSDETKQKISLVNKGKILSDETKQKISLAKKGKKHSEETKQKMSSALKGNQNGKGNKGKKHSEETKQKMSSAKKGKILSDETKQKMSKAMKGKHWRTENGKRVYY